MVPIGQKNKWDREENKVMLQCYLKKNKKQKGGMKCKMELWDKNIMFKTVKTSGSSNKIVLKKGLFSDLEIMEISGTESGKENTQ